MKKSEKKALVRIVYIYNFYVPFLLFSFTHLFVADVVVRRSKSRHSKEISKKKGEEGK